jgi:hypothetical protein
MASLAMFSQSWPTDKDHTHLFIAFFREEAALSRIALRDQSRNDC